MIERPPLVVGKGAKRLGCGLAIVVAALFALAVGLSPYCEYLWFKEDARQLPVLLVRYETKGLLFLVSFVLSLTVLYASLRRALNLSMVFLDRPETVGQVIGARMLDAAQRSGPLITKLASLLLAFIVASAFANEWNAYLLWAHSQPFQHLDPIFQIDLSFFTFTLPWEMAVINLLFGLSILTTVLTFGVYAGTQSMATLARIELGRPAIRAHLALLVGTTLVILGVRIWMQRYQYGLLDNGQFTGAGYAATRQLGIQGFLAGLVVVVGLLGLASSFWEKLVRPASYGVGLSILVYLLGLVAYPAVLQFAEVNPDKLRAESPYASRAIAMTRFAYALDKIDVRETTVHDEPTPTDLAGAKGTLDNMRLWDPEVLQHSIEALQGLKPYYKFRDVDLDRYRIGGKERMVMIAPRDIDTAGLVSSAQTWVNTRLQYTHGFGVTVSPVNEVTSSGQPAFLVRDIPPVTPSELPVTQPRIYFSDFRANGSTDNYVVVNTKVPEFDYPSELNDKYTNWTGNRGIDVGALLPKLAFSFVLGDTNLLISGNITSNSRLLLHRGVVERAQLIYPFLNFDADPYIVALGGRLLWVLDGYTSSDQVPYSAHTTLGDWTMNYARNAVKVVVDAYTGESKAYAIDRADPVLRTYEGIYPGLVADAEAMPSGLQDHLRYPEDLFNIQSYQLTQYHVTEPIPFLNNEDAWDMPTERGLSGSEEAMRPYYVEMRLPQDASEQFLLILPFTPRKRGNMSGWLAAHCDTPEYGRLILYEYPKGSILPGPKQMEANFSQSPAIANLNTLLHNEQSNIIVGNLLVMPIGDSVMYVEPMFLSSQGVSAIPQLKKVILALRERVVVADSYSEALAMLFGSQSPGQAGAEAPGPAPGTGAAKGGQEVASPSLGTVSKSEVAQALKLAKDADAALKSGDFAKYGELQKQLRAKLEQMAAK